MSDVDPLGNRPADYHTHPALEQVQLQSAAGVPLTGRAMVRDVAESMGHPVPSDDLCDFILWERTAFPVANVHHIREQVIAYFADPAAADALAESYGEP